MWSLCLRCLFPKTGFRGYCKLPCGCWESNLDPPEGQPVLVITEPPLWTPIKCFLHRCWALNHHFHQMEVTFITLRKLLTPYPLAVVSWVCLPHSCKTTNLLSVSVELPVLDILCKWNHITWLCLSRLGTSSRFIHAAAGTGVPGLFMND